MSQPKLLSTVAAAALAGILALAAAAQANPKPPSPSAGSGSPTVTQTSAFQNFSVAETPGVTCPGSSACSNFASEPAIRADRAGNFYATSENGLGGGTLGLKSSDGGLHYTTVASPDAGSASNNTGFAPGGGDTDVATAPKANATGRDNVYVVSLSLANVDVSTSSDGGQTWSLNPIGALVSGDDRPWVAADGASKVCVSYHDVATDNIDVNCSNGAGAAGTFTQLGSAIDTNHLWLINNNEIGNLTIDPATHDIYQLFSGIASQSEVVGGELSTVGYHAVWMAVSTDGGQTFTDYPVHTNPNTSVSYGHQFVNSTVDSAGNAYAVYSDDHNLYYSYSIDHGRTWSAPSQINSGPSATAIEPWSIAGSNGALDVVWYGTSYYSSSTTPDNYPATAAWFVYFAQNLTALTSPGNFTQQQASPIVHYGGVCESGVTCTGNRDLYDDFGVAANPLTGLASIAYSDDQFSSAEPVASGCSAATTNSSSCDHTAIATETSGSGIYSTTTTPTATTGGSGGHHKTKTG